MYSFIMAVLLDAIFKNDLGDSKWLAATRPTIISGIETLIIVTVDFNQ